MEPQEWASAASHPAADAMHVRHAVAVPSRVIVVCPNHTGVGPALALAPPGAWPLPTGAVPANAPRGG